MIAFGLIGGWIGGSSDDTEAYDEEMTVIVHDELGVFADLEEAVTKNGLPWSLAQTDLTEDEITNELTDNENVAYVYLDEEAILDGAITVYTSDEVDPFFINQVTIFQEPIIKYQMDQLGLTTEQSDALGSGVYFEEIAVEADDKGVASDDFLAKIVPAAFAGIIFISIVFTGMAIFQSASQEKKDKIAEIILSSLTPGELMQGKIIGYFVLGLIQTTVLLVFIVPFIRFQTDIPLLEYIFVPETILYVALAVLNYLMFAAIFVGIGATMEDVSTAGNFQGMVIMLPFLPFLFIGPVIGDPSGLMAQIGTYIPFTAPGVLLLRLALLDVWPWVEIIISLVIILISTGLFIKLAGKIFQVGILMYGKNATPAEIWKWIRA